jgi:Protein of unknown function (DUF3987)
MGLAVQPDVIQGLASNRTFRGRGLLGRFLYALPKSLVGHREINPDPVPAAIRGEYREKTRALLGTQPATDAEGEPTEHVIGLSAEAYAIWLGFAGWLEPQLGDFGPLAHMSDWAGKLAGAVARIVGLLHLSDLAGLEAPWSIPVPGTTMAQAIEIGRYLIPHARAAFAEMGADPDQSDAKYLLNWIRRNGTDWFKRSDCYEATKGHFRQVEAMEPALELLQKQNYIRRRMSPTRSGPGRPIGLAYNVNPAALLGPGSPPAPTAAISHEPECAACEETEIFGDCAIPRDADPGLSLAENLASFTAPVLPIQAELAIVGQADEGVDEYEEGLI